MLIQSTVSACLGGYGLNSKWKLPDLKSTRVGLHVRSHYHRWQGRLQDPNFRIARNMGLEGLLAAIVLNLGTANNNMFVSRLGGGADQLGLLASLPQLFAMFVLIPGTLLLGKIKSSRKPVAITALLAGLLYSLAAFTPYFPETFRITYFILVIALANVPVQLYNSTWQNYFTDAVAFNDRNTAFTTRTSLTFIAGVLTVQLTGLLLGWAGDRPLRMWMYQTFYFLTLVVAILQLRKLKQMPDATSPSSGTKLKDMLVSLKLIFSQTRTRVFIILALFFHGGWYMGWQLFFILQVDYMGANETWLSIITVSSVLVQWIMVKPWGTFIRKRGVRLALVIGTAGLALNPVFSIMASYFPYSMRLPAMLILNLISAFTFPAFQLSFFQALLEVIPDHQRNLNISLFNTMLLATNSLMQIAGTGLYSVLGSNHLAITLALLTAAGIRMIGSVLFFLYWRRLRRETDAGIVIGEG